MVASSSGSERQGIGSQSSEGPALRIVPFRPPRGAPLCVLQLSNRAIVVQIGDAVVLDHNLAVDIDVTNGTFGGAVDQIAQRIVDRLHGRMAQVHKSQVRLGARREASDVAAAKGSRSPG